MIIYFYFKQKTAYEMRISDWSSDVCSSDLQPFDVRGFVEAGNDDEDFHPGRNTIIHGPPHDRDDAARTAVDGWDVMARSEASRATSARHSARPVDHSPASVAASAADRPS